MTVKVGVMPGQISEYALESGATVAQALETAGLDSTGYDIRVNGAAASLDNVLADGSIVLLVKKIKGNADGFITVKAGVMPGQINQYALETDATVEDVLEQAGLDPNGFEVRVNGMTGSLETPLADGAIVLLVKKIKGNR